MPFFFDDVPVFSAQFFTSRSQESSSKDFFFSKSIFDLYFNSRIHQRGETDNVYLTCFVLKLLFESLLTEKKLSV